MESLLFVAGALPRKGSVKEGNTVGDASLEAKARQMSVEASLAACTYQGEAWTLIDCPGSVEFSQEAAHILGHFIRARGGQVNFIDHGDNGQVRIERLI